MHDKADVSPKPTSITQDEVKKIILCVSEAEHDGVGASQFLFFFRSRHKIPSTYKSI